MYTNYGIINVIVSEVRRPIILFFNSRAKLFGYKEGDFLLHSYCTFSSLPQHIVAYNVATFRIFKSVNALKQKIQ